MSINHETEAIRYIEAADAAVEALHAAYAAPHLADQDRRHAAGEAHRRIGHALKIAHIHATLAAAQGHGEVLQLLEDLAARIPVPYEVAL